MNGPMDVKTAGRTVDLFEVFAKARTPLTLSEIAAALNAPQSSCFNLLRSLEARGYLYAVGANKRVYPTRKLFEIADAIAEYEPVIPRAAAKLAALGKKTQETVILGARQGDKVIYLSVIEGPQTIRYISRAGELKPMHASAIGKALLMQLPQVEREKLVAKLSLKSTTERTIVSRDGLLEDIAAAEERGYTQTCGENVADVMAVAVPTRIDGIAYAVAVAGPIGRVEPLAAEHAASIRAAVEQL